jgi:preprotein translocase subunit SecD
VTGAPAKDDAPVVGPVDLVVPIEMRPVLDARPQPPTEPSGTVAPTEPSGAQLPDPSGEVLSLAGPIMTIDHLDRAEVMHDKASGTWALSLDLTDADAATFASWTSEHVDERLAIVIDGKVIVAPTIQSAITGGVVQIIGNYTRDDVTDLLDKITGR